MFAYEETIGRAGFAITDRHGGVSSPPYDGLNLATHVGDDPRAVQRNREFLASAVGVESAARLYVLSQQHGAEVVVARGPAPAQPLEADAVVSAEPGLALTILVADCTPVLAADPEAGVVGAAHAGRRGLAAGVVPRMIEAMRDLGARSLQARLGPSICAACYPVPYAMREEVAAIVPEARATDRSGNPALDIAAGLERQLADAEVAVRRIPGCSRESADLYSYRRDSVTGRYAGLVWLSRRA